MFGVLALLLVVSPPHFGAAPGWHVGSGPALTSRSPATGASRPRAGRRPFGTGIARNCLPPHRTLAHLPAGGIVIQLAYGRERPARAPVGKWPPRIRAAKSRRGSKASLPLRRVPDVRSDRDPRALSLRLVRPRPSRRGISSRARTPSYGRPARRAASGRPEARGSCGSPGSGQSRSRRSTQTARSP